MSQSSLSLLERTLDQAWGAVHRQAVSSEAIWSMVSQALSFLNGLEPGAEQERRTAEMAYLMADIAQFRDDAALARKVLLELPSLGPAGEYLAASFLLPPRSPEQLLRPLFDKLSANRRLALINRVLSRPRPEHGCYSVWAAEQAHEIQGDDPEEVLVFLDGLVEASEKPAYALQRELVRGRFAFWLQELVGLELDSNQARYLARVATTLDCDGLCTRYGLLLRHASVQDLPVVLDSIARLGARADAKTIQACALFLMHNAPEVRLAAGRALVKMKAKQAVPGLAELFADPQLRGPVLVLALDLTPAHFVNFIKLLGAQSLPGTLAMALRFLARLDSAILAGVLNESRPPGLLEKDIKELPAITALVKDVRPVLPLTEYSPEPPEAFVEQDGEQHQSLLGRMRRFLGQEEGQQPSDDQVRLSALTPGQSLDKASMKDAGALGKDLTDVALTDTRLVRVALPQAVMKQTRFSKCSLHCVDFSRSHLDGVVFSDCELTSCRFSGSALNKVQFINCRLRSTHFDGVLTSDMQTHGCRFEQCLLWGMHAERWVLRHSLFALADLSYVALVASDFDGVEFEDCLFGHGYVRDTRLRNVATCGCVFAHLAVTGVDMDEPHFCTRQVLTRQTLAMPDAEREIWQGPSKNLQGAAGAKAMLHVVQECLRQRDMQRHYRWFLAANHRRMQWALAKLGSQRKAVVCMLPGLLEAPLVTTKEGFESAPRCTITGYSPGLQAMELLAEHFSEAPKDGGSGEHGKEIAIEAFYSIGSVGTIAQTRSSDLDLWLCYDGQGLSPDDVTLLDRKLRAIEQWAEKEFALEIHFFAMDLEDVRVNNFGFSDRESAGSSQALLLKEEFYRTALCLAGRNLAWWMIPSVESEEEYDQWIERIQSSPTLRRQKVVDLGMLWAVPRSEFFGASLWQIVKALKSPFKSALKFALLDAYIAGAGPEVLLCNLLKRNVVSGRRDFWGLDPYALLYAEVANHYSSTGNEDAEQLLRLAFEQKTGFSTQRRTSGRLAEMRGYSFMEYQFPCIAPEELLDKKRRGAGPTTFAELKNIGEQLARFLFRAYESVRNGTVGLDLDAHITEEDITRLGRRILGQFQAKPNKIMPTPFMESPAGLFSALTLSGEGGGGVLKGWVVKGEQLATLDHKAGQEFLQRDPNPVRLLLWLVANHLYRPGVQVLGSSLQAPVSVRDIQALLDDFVQAFSPREIFDPEIEEALMDEKVVKAMIVVNYQAERDVKHLADVTLVYATNWGELFCLPNPEGVNILESDPRGFVAKNTVASVDAHTDMVVHLPQKSQGPRIVMV